MDDLDLDLLDLPNADDLLDAEAITGTKHRHRTRGTRRTCKQLLHVANAAHAIDRLPDPDEAVHIVMAGNFNAWDIVPACIKLAGVGIDSLAVATLGFNKRNADELLGLIDEAQVGSVAFLCSCYFRDANGREFTHLADGLEERGQQIAATRSHAKVMAMRFTDGRCVTTESSANLRSCRNLEQMTLHGSPDLHDFHANWIGEQMPYGRTAIK